MYSKKFKRLMFVVTRGLAQSNGTDRVSTNALKADTTTGGTRLLEDNFRTLVPLVLKKGRNRHPSGNES